MTLPTQFLTTLEREIIDLVVVELLTARKGIARRKLVQMFEQPELLDRMIKRSLLSEVDCQLCLPTLVSFEFCGLEDNRLFAKNCVAKVIKCLQSLYNTESEKVDFTLEDVRTRAFNLFETTDHQTVWLGLYLIREFGVLDSYSWNLQTLEMSSLRPSERIVTLKDIGGEWDKIVAQRTAYWLSEGQFPARDLLSSLELGKLYQATNLNEPMIAANMLLFISHSSKDADVALSLIELLQAALGLKPDQIRCTSVEGYRLVPGANIDDVLKTEILNAKAFIGLITPNSLRSAYVLFELGARWGAQLHMVPLLAGVEPSTVEGPLKAINAISCENTNQLHELLSGIADALDGEVARAATYNRYLEKLAVQVQKVFPQAGNVTPPRSNPKPIRPSGRKHGSAGSLRSLTRESVIATSKHLRWSKQLPKWTVEVDGTSFPVRPLAFKAAGLLPNDAATTHQAVAKLKELGFEVFYEGQPA